MEESMSNPNPYWRRNLSPLDRQAVDNVGEWLRPVPWQWFVTLTLSGNIRAETATGKLRHLANELEWFHKKNVCFVAGMESGPAFHGIRVPWHFHLLLASHAHLSKQAIEITWVRQVGRYTGLSKIRECVMVEPYDPDRLGPEYGLKMMNDTNGEWITHRLEHFLPNLPNPSKPNHRILRSAKRARLQAIPPPIGS
jgi:hypothetical protein